MEKRYTLIEIGETSGETSVIKTEHPFKKYLFETALSKGRTDIEDQGAFDRAIEVYKRLKEMTYLGGDELTVEIDDTGNTETFTREEANAVVEAMEKKVVDVQGLLTEIRNRLEEIKRDPRIVVYTCITGGYDSIKEPSFVTPGVDYVCFTDNLSMKSKTWDIRPIPDELLGYTKVKQQRGVKILPHRYLPEYDISVWVDGNMDVKGNIVDYLKTFDFNTYSVFIPEHPARKCIYKEKDACVRIKKITGDGIILANKQMERYRKEKFPENNGLVQTNIVIRKHNDEYSKKLMELWWSELKEYSHRDQLSFNYALWKTGKERFKYLIKTTCNSKTFRWAIKHKK